MSHQATAWAFKQQGLKPATKIVLLYLADHHNPEHGCFPSQKRLAAECEMSERALRDHLGKLEKLNLITRTSRKSGTTFLSDVYELHFDRQVTEAGTPAAKSAGRQNLPQAENDNSPRQNLPPNPVRGISKNAREGNQNPTDVIPQNCLVCIPHGSSADERWRNSDWFKDQGHLLDFADALGDGYAAPGFLPPARDDAFGVGITRKWIERILKPRACQGDAA